MLSLLFSPAREVFAIVTADSRPVSRQALKRAHDFGAPKVTLTEREVDSADAIGVYKAIRDTIEGRAGRGSGVVVDITSGSKAMTAAASLATGQLNLRQVYIAGQKLGRSGLTGMERPSVLEHPLVVLGDSKRSEAERAFDAIAST